MKLRDVLLVASLSAAGLLSCGDAATEKGTVKSEADINPTVQAQNKMPIKGYGLEDRVEDFTLKNVDGNDVNFQSYLKGQKGAVVIFTCNHCPYAVKYEDRIIALDKKYRPLGYPVVAVNPNDPAEQPEDSYEMMQKRAAEKGFTFPYLFDEGQQVYPKFGASRTPHVFVVALVDDAPVLKYIGAVDDNTDDAGAVKERYVENAIDALLRNEEVPVKTTKAIGCTIKVKQEA